MKTTRSFKLITAFLLLFLAWILLAWYAAERLIVAQPMERAEAIWILGGSAAYIERTQEAALLFKNGTAPKIFLTNDGTKAGWSRKEQRNTPYIELAEQSLIRQGVPNDAIEILPPITKSTQDEANLLTETAKERGLKSVLLVTSAYHTRRTLWTFEKTVQNNNISIEIGIESPPTGQQTPPPFYWWLTTRGWNVVAGEYLKTVYYWLYY
ncbi:MAG: YdcF family protein [Pyrinomonadaceae bacterium]